MRLPTPALTVSVAALLVALGGTGYAAGLIGSKDVRNNSLTGVDVKNQTLTGRDVKNGTLKGKDVRRLADPRTLRRDGPGPRARSPPAGCSSTARA